jgi:hypothetical protein
MALNGDACAAIQGATTRVSIGLPTSLPSGSMSFTFYTARTTLPRSSSRRTASAHSRATYCRRGKCVEINNAMIGYCDRASACGTVGGHVWWARGRETSSVSCPIPRVSIQAERGCLGHSRIDLMWRAERAEVKRQITSVSPVRCRESGAPLAMPGWTHSSDGHGAESIDGKRKARER